MTYQSGFRQGLFDGQRILIPGGGGGLGRCIAHELSHLGAQVALVGRSLEKLEKTRAEIVEDGGTVLGIYSVELRDEEAVRALVSAVLAQHGQIHGLVNAAGGQFPAALKDLSLNGWNSVINNNLTSYFLTSREMFTQCFEQHGGNIVHIGADYHRGMPGMGHNGAARAGLANLTMTSAVEWAGSNVRVNGVIPGFIGTTGLDRYPDSAWDGLRKVVQKSPIARHGTAAEISAAVVFLMSEMAAFITGTEIIVDGGMQFGNGSFVFRPEQREVGVVFEGFHRDEKARILSE